MAECCTVNQPPAAAPAVMSCPVSGTRSKKVDILKVNKLKCAEDLAETECGEKFGSSPDREGGRNP